MCHTEVNEHMDPKNSYMRIKFHIMNKDGYATGHVTKYCNLIGYTL